jgi:hypothetical protein
VFEGPTLRDISSNLTETDLEIAVTALATDQIGMRHIQSALDADQILKLWKMVGFVSVQ